MADDALAALRAKAKPPTAAVRRGRVDATMDPDARKARDIVRAVATTDDPPSVGLAEIATHIAKVTANAEVRARLEHRVELFHQGVATYLKEELQAPEKVIAWLGDRTGQFGHAPPPNWPAHRVELVAAWLAPLQAVNEATKVGVQKDSKFRPITLIADPDAAPLAPVTPEWN